MCEATCWEAYDARCDIVENVGHSIVTESVSAVLCAADCYMHSNFTFIHMLIQGDRSQSVCLYRTRYVSQFSAATGTPNWDYGDRFALFAGLFV